MLDLTAIHRFRYCPSGKIITNRFLVGSIFLFLASGVAGFVLMLLYSIVGLVPVLLLAAILAPIVVGLSIGWLVGKHVEFSHCRSPLAGSSIGAICGAVVFLSACHIAGVLAALRSGELLSLASTRVDRIPEVIISRAFAPDLKNQRSDDSSQLNIPRTVILIIEFSILVWIPLVHGRSVAERAYDEQSGRWLERSTVRAISGSGDKIVSALQGESNLTSTLNAIELCSSDPRPANPKFIRIDVQKKGQVAASWMVFEFQGDQISDDCQLAYLTVTEISPQGKRTLLLKQLQLQLNEINAAKKLFLG